MDFDVFDPADEPVWAFVQAFNARDRAGLLARLPPNATAEVLGSGFGTEMGPDDILAKSLEHLMEESWERLGAETLRHDDADWIVFRSKLSLDVSCAARVDVAAGLITRLEYLVARFRADDLAAVAEAWKATLR